MEELIECIVKRKLTIKVYTARCFMVTFCLFMILITLVFGGNVPYMMPVLVIADTLVGIATYCVFRNTNVEFEYDFFGGELTIDKIMSKAKRKRLRVLDLKELEIMAPTTSDRITRIPKPQNAVKCSYTTCEIGATTYTAIFKGDSNGTVYLEFSPNEQLLAHLKKLYSRKVYED